MEHKTLDDGAILAVRKFVSTVAKSGFGSLPGSA